MSHPKAVGGGHPLVKRHVFFFRLRHRHTEQLWASRLSFSATIVAFGAAFVPSSHLPIHAFSLKPSSFVGVVVLLLRHPKRLRMIIISACALTGGPRRTHGSGDTSNRKALSNRRTCGT